MTISATTVCALICISTLLHHGNARLIDGKPLHHRMTDKEIRHYFGVEAHSSVPEYDVITPFESNENGHFVSYVLDGRSKRSVPEDDHVRHFKMDTFGKQLHLQLRQNTKFMAPGLQLEERDVTGRMTQRPVSRDNYFTGHVASDPGSFVALSVKDGLTGMMKRSRDTYFLHPLPTHLAQHFISERGARPHLVYKTPSQSDVKCQTKEDTISVAKRDTGAVVLKQEEDMVEPPHVAEKYLKVALLADQGVIDIHGNKTEEFLLLVASIADSMFQDATIGDIKINYVVTRLVLVTDPELAIDTVGDLLLWAKNNKKSESDQGHFDVASAVRSKGSGGVANFNVMCRQNSVNMNTYNGYQTAYTIVHETAHNLGVGHDGNKMECPDGVNIMSKVLVDGPGALEWSPCSREKIQKFLTNKAKTCLDDVPTTLRPRPPYSFYTMLPGELADGDVQCKAQYRSVHYKQCSHTLSNCASLYCTLDGYQCVSHFSPPLDGTPCGTRKWCIKGYCVDNGKPKIHGGWSEWSEYTTCTPPCGGGVRHRERTCTNPSPQNGGNNCAGSSTGFWEICNSEVECNTSAPSFRDMQCIQEKPTSVAYYRTGVNPCNLYCRSGRQVQSKGNVISGTRCYGDRVVYDVCIEANCRVVGCDKVLESGKMKDRCGICSGNGDTCTLVKSSYTTNYRKYNRPVIIAHLPAGSANIEFQERGPTYNLIGIQDENGTFLIPMRSWSNRVVYKAGTKISYFNRNRFPDRLTIEGPTNMPLRVVFVYLAQEPNIGIDYRYFRPLLPEETPVNPSCHWISSNWSDCSSSTVEQSREVRCVRSDDLSPASNNCCDEASKPDKVNRCLESPQWHVSDWLPCSKTCGKGSQSRSVVCRTKLNATYYEENPDSFCNVTLKPNMTTFLHCNEIKCPAHWQASSWTKCPTVCLPDTRARDVKCTQTNKLGVSEQVADIRCEYEPRPPASEQCNHDNPCKKLAIGCFKTPNGMLSQIGDFRGENDPNNSAIAKCGELAHSKGFRVFALSDNGLCFSGADAQHKYFINGTVDKSACPNGIGRRRHKSYVYSFDSVPAFKPLGCFKDKLFPNRALPDLYANFRSHIDWFDMDATIRQCASVARDKGYEYFAVQFYGECFSAPDAADTYDKYGEENDPKRCPSIPEGTKPKVGGSYTNYVYRFIQIQ